jgi:hypothetical protein
MLSTARENSDGMAVLYALQRITFGLYVSGSGLLCAAPRRKPSRWDTASASAA